MRKLKIIWIIAAAVMLLLPSGALAQEAKVKVKGINPDSLLWGIDVAIDNLSLLLTFNNTEKATKGLEIAKERLMETKEMILQQRLELAEKAQAEHNRTIIKVKTAVKNSEEKIGISIKIEEKLEEHENDVLSVERELDIKIRLKGTFGLDSRELVDSILSKLGNSTGDLKVSIKEKKDSIKIRIKQDTGKSDAEIEKEIEEAEEEHGLKEAKMEKAAERIADAKDKINELESGIASLGNTTIPGSVNELLANAKDRLADAESAFAENDFGEAFGQATAATNTARNAIRILERQTVFDSRTRESISIKTEVDNTTAQVRVEIRFTPRSIEKESVINEMLEKVASAENNVSDILKIENRTEVEAEEKLEAEVRLKNGIPNAEIEWSFSLNETQEDKIVEGILAKLSSLTKEQLDSVFELELKEKPNVKIEAKTEGNVTNVEVRINGDKFSFSLTDASRENIIDETMSRTGLAREQIESSIKFDVDKDRGVKKSEIETESD